MLVASTSVFGRYSRRQLLANAAIAASRVGSKPCVGVQTGNLIDRIVNPSQNNVWR